MAFTLDQIVPWGRSLSEYRRMFSLTEADLAGSLIGVGDGPASANAELAAQGRRMVSVDPIYSFSAAEIQRRIDDTYARIVDPRFVCLGRVCRSRCAGPSSHGHDGAFSRRL
jgi:hypothetical protein